MQIKLVLALPRDELSVPVARRVLKGSLTTLGVRDDLISDIELALTEACTNVLDHAAESDEYELTAGIDGRRCVIEIADKGSGFDGSGAGLSDADSSAEDGRGIQLMRSLVDRLTFSSLAADGTVVHLEKELEWVDDAPATRLADAHEPDGARR